MINLWRKFSNRLEEKGIDDRKNTSSAKYAKNQRMVREAPLKDLQSALALGYCERAMSPLADLAAGTGRWVGLGGATLFCLVLDCGNGVTHGREVRR